MYHLLVSTTPWAAPSGTIATGRTFEFTTDQIEKIFKPEGALDERKVIRIPALFASETGYSGDQIARVGYIQQVSVSTTQINLRFTFEESVPPISNAELLSMADALNLGDRELYRTHWAIKDVDLFQVLYKRHASSPLSPSVFSFADLARPQRRLVSVMMPFAPTFDKVASAIKTACASLDLECKRADDFWEHEAIIQDIVALICRSSVVICDCTGRNPNVFYEAGIAHSLGKPVILISQSEADIPFDLRHLRYLPYLNNDEGLRKLAADIAPRLQHLTSAS